MSYVHRLVWMASASCALGMSQNQLHALPSVLPVRSSRWNRENDIRGVTVLGAGLAAATGRIRFG